MCGIAGYLGAEDIPADRIDRCLALMGRRGPDHAAHRRWRTASGKTALLLHTRLSIIDPDPRSHQPLQVGSRWIASNGELYNYLELRRELEARGRLFRTASDSEVLLSAVDDGGTRALDRCEGMWAFAVFDERDGSLTLCRDRFGEKPLHLFRTSSGLFFASEVKFLAALLGRRLEVRRPQVLRFLVNGYKSLFKKEETFFEGVTDLVPGSVLRVDAEGREESLRYWNPRLEQDASMTREEAVAGARERLIRSMQLRLRSDVPLAFLMSGGIDSNSLIGIARRILGYDVHGFTILNTDARYEEQEMVDLAVSRFGIRHTALPIRTQGFLENLRTLVRYHDAPVTTIADYARWLLMESVAGKGYRVSVSGNGADELFTGYYDHHLFYLYEVRGDAALRVASQQAWREHILPFVRNPFLKDPDLILRQPEFRGHIFLKAEEFAKALTMPWSEPFFEEVFSKDLLRNRMLNEVFRETVPVLVHEEDLNAMYHSIENRSPFLDRELFEFCTRIPTRHLMREGFAKSVLRDAMRGLVPDPILDNRRKVGFNAPIFSFLDPADPEVRNALLEPSPIFDLIRRQSVDDLLRKPDLPNSESKFLFNVLSVKLFLEEQA